MKKQEILVLASLFLAGLYVSGCSKDNGSGPTDEQVPANVTNEQSARIELAKADEFVKNDELTIADTDIQPTDYGTFGKVAAEITPLRWGRFVTQVTVAAWDTVLLGDTIAVVHIRKLISGVLKIKAKTGAGDTVQIDKNFQDEAARRVVFKRIARETRRYWLNWLPVATSLVSGGTQSGSIAIKELKLKWPTDSVTITDPLAYFMRYKWLRWYDGGEKPVPEINAGDPVTMRVTVVSASPDTDIVVLRHGFAPFQRRRHHMTLVSETPLAGGKYERVFETSWFGHFHVGFFHAAVDAVTRETLFDDTAPYSVSWWGIPYRVF